MPTERVSQELGDIIARLQIAKSFAAMKRDPDEHGPSLGDWYARDVAFLLAGKPYGLESWEERMP